MSKTLFHQDLANNANLKIDQPTSPPPSIKGLEGGGLNIADEALNRHLEPSVQNKLALRWIGKDDRVMDFTYSELNQQTSRFADLLAELGLSVGSRIFTLAGRVPELYIAALGTLKAGCVFTPLFSAFGPEPIRSRMEIGSANLIVTTRSLYRKKLKGWWRELPHLKAVVLIDGNPDNEPGCYDY